MLKEFSVERFCEGEEGACVTNERVDLREDELSKAYVKRRENSWR